MNTTDLRYERFTCYECSGTFQSIDWNCARHALMCSVPDRATAQPDSRTFGAVEAASARPEAPTPYSPLTKPIQTALDFLQERRDWRHVLALMRLRFSEKEIKDFTPASMLTVVRDACRSVKIGGEKAAEALAKSFGL